MNVNGSVSHSFQEETLEAKSRWFRSLSVSERMEVLCEFTDLALSMNPSFRSAKLLNRVKDVFKSFQEHDVRYVVIGGIAAILHGVPRLTFNLDVLIDPTPDNAQNLLDALLDIDLGTASLITVDELLQNEITVFSDRIRLDVQTSTPGIEFAQVWKNKVTLDFQGQSFHVLSRADLISFKRAAGRGVDLEDVRLLEETEGREASEERAGGDTTGE